MSIHALIVNYYLFGTYRIMTGINQELHQHAPSGNLPPEVSQRLASMIHELQENVMQNRGLIEFHAAKIHPANKMVVCYHLDQVLKYNIEGVWLRLCAAHKAERYKEIASSPNMEVAVEKASNKRRLPTEFEEHERPPKRHCH